MTRDHWPEYLTEGACLALFMTSAAAFATLLQHPASPLTALVGGSYTRRIPMGLAMGLTLAIIVYSPLGRRSGAHMNPAVTLTFFRLGKIDRRDVAGYITAQFAGGFIGIAAANALLRGLPAHPAVNYVATVPGRWGVAAAFVAEALIAFGMMLLVLTLTNTSGTARYTGICAGLLVAAYITFEAPLSGMSMNPARTLGPAILARSAPGLWIYFVAPPLGMLLAAEAFVTARSARNVRCAKLHHTDTVRCIFNCGYAHAAEEMRVPA
jgi:aquaporin Z